MRRHNRGWPSRMPRPKAAKLPREAMQQLHDRAARFVEKSFTHPHTLESLNNLIALYEAWNKREKTKEWRAKLSQIEDFEE